MRLKAMLLALLIAFSLMSGHVAAMPTEINTTPHVSYQESDERCFPETSFCISGAIRAYWEANGGLPVFGYPISPLRVETIEGTWTGPVQWFERDRLEDHGPDGVWAGRLGVAALNQQGIRWWTPESQVNPDDVPPSCNYYLQTGHSICEPFLSFWLQNGGVERFGYPMTEQMTATIGGIGGWQGTVQYFERRRMELHFGGTVLLGLLGNELRDRISRPGACEVPVSGDLHESFLRVPFRETLGCPRANPTDHPAATVQPFEYGEMIALNMGDDLFRIFTLYVDQEGFPSHQVSELTIDPNRVNPEPTPTDDEEGEEQLPIWVGFRRVLERYIDIQDALGAPSAPEMSQFVTAQAFDRGTILWMRDSDIIHAIGPFPRLMTSMARPTGAVDTPNTPANDDIIEPLGGQPAPPLDGYLVVQTRSVDYYRYDGGLDSEAIIWIGEQTEEAIERVTAKMGTPGLAGRIAIRFEPAMTGPCAYRGLTLSNERIILLYYEPGTNPSRVVSILAHEFAHQLQQDYYGSPHLISDIILLEGMATWASSDYFLADDGRPRYQHNVREGLAAGELLPLTTDLDQDCRTGTRNYIYDQWASFTEYLITTYGREKLDAVYVRGVGRAPGSADYIGVYGKSLAELEADWLAWLAAQS